VCGVLVTVLVLRRRRAARSWNLRTRHPEHVANTPSEFGGRHDPELRSTRSLSVAGDNQSESSIRVIDAASRGYAALSLDEDALSRQTEVSQL
jgi:hypothetical protein